MVPSGPEAVDPAVQHVGDPGQGVPVAEFAIGQRPAQPFQGQPPLDDGVLIDIRVVVVIDELVPDGLAEDQDDGQEQKDGHGRRPESVIRPAMRFRAGGLLRCNTAIRRSRGRSSGTVGIVMIRQTVFPRPAAHGETAPIRFRDRLGQCGSPPIAENIMVPNG